MMAKLYEFSVVVESYINQVDTALEVAKDIINETNGKLLGSNNDFKVQVTSFIICANFILQHASKFKKEIEDKDMLRELDILLNFSNHLAYYYEMIMFSLSQPYIFDSMVLADVERYLKLIYNMTSDGGNAAHGIKYSDYCYIERGLLKEEDFK